MLSLAEVKDRLRAIPELQLREDEPLAPYTRFELGGKAALVCTTDSRRAFVEALRTAAPLDASEMVIGGGTNLVVSDDGFDALAKTAAEIRAVRDAKYPPTMKCAGSIFKNVFFANLPIETQALIPPNLIREGKVPSAFFLEQVGAKGIRRGDIQVAKYHANLIYNDGEGRAADVVALIRDLKKRVRDR